MKRLLIELNVSYTTHAPTVLHNDEVRQKDERMKKTHSQIEACHTELPGGRLASRRCHKRWLQSGTSLGRFDRRRNVDSTEPTNA